MHRILISLIAVSTLGLGGALAQDLVVTPEPDFGVTTQYVGGSLGYPGLQAYYHSEDIDFIEDSDIRFRASISPFGGFSFLVGADALFDLTELSDDGNLDLYAGGGPAVGFASGFVTDINGNRVSYSGFALELSGVIGVNYRLNQDISLFAEGGLGFGFVSASAGGFAPTFRSGLGANYHF